MSTGSPARRAATLTWAVNLLYGEAGAVSVLAGYLLYASVAETTTSIVGALLVTAFAAAAAAALWALARALGGGRGGGRGLAVVLQLMVLCVGYYMVTGGLPVAGAVVLAYGAAVTVLLCLPDTTRALGLHRRS
ncbi:MAG TPA: hypothetical protein VFY17_11245 [Pilimelia sp.]|nr:hypothetical protein [Pilimelia sp.]